LKANQHQKKRSHKNKYLNPKKLKKVLFIIPPYSNGCTYHRLEIPMHTMQGIEKHVTTILDGVTDEQLKSIDMVYFQGSNGIVDVKKQVKRLKALGMPYIVDIDDYWILNKEHLLKKGYSKHTRQKKLLMENATFVTTTTPQLATEIKKFNKKVEVCVNAIDSTQPQFEIRKRNSDEFVFGWIGGIHHYIDIKILEDYFTLMNDMPLLIGGVDNHPVWDLITAWSSCNGTKKNYYPIKATNVYSYGFMYDLLDVALIPLAKNKFNSFKSELKMVEAGMKKKAVIVSDVQPYTNLITGKNCLSASNGDEFYRKMRFLQNNKEYANELAENLYEDVQKKYSLAEANKRRIQIINSI